MTQEDKELLLKDLCARLPYGTKITNGIYTITLKVRIDTAPATLAQFINSEGLKYYLRPMSSMTDEEKEFIETCISIVSAEDYGDYWSPSAWHAMNDFVNYCNEHHLDNQGLISKGIALEAPEGMYK